jgi:hypothetical protein
VRRWTEILQSALTPIDSAWHHVAVVRASGKVVAYLDGALEASSADSSHTAQVTGTPFYLGRGLQPVDLFTGSISGVFLAQRALAASEVQSLFLRTASSCYAVNTTGACTCSLTLVGCSGGC